MNTNSSKIRTMTITAVFAAIIFIFTAYIHIPSHTGYTHIGDAFIYLAACLLPFPYASLAGAIGAGLADLLSGYALWAPGTIVIKAATALYFSNKTQKIICKRNLLGLIPSFATCVGGYYLYEVLITSNFKAPLLGIPGYIIQVIASSLCFLYLGYALQKAGIKRMIGGTKE